MQRAASTLKKGINSAVLQGFHTEESGGGGGAGVGLATHIHHSSLLKERLKNAPRANARQSTGR